MVNIRIKLENNVNLFSISGEGLCGFVRYELVPV